MKRTVVALGLLATLLPPPGAPQTPEKRPVMRPAAYLAESIAAAGLERASEVLTFTGSALFEYINGGAELYHLYGFREVATAYYARGETEVVLDIYLFRNPTSAYGLYSNMRPPDPEPANLGVQGFASPAHLEYVKGSFLVRLVAYDQSPPTAELLQAAARAIEPQLPGTTRPPAALGLFPQAARVDFSDQIIAASYLGQAFLTDVYTQKYLLGDDPVTLFLTKDPSGDKFRQWFREVADADNLEKVAREIPFERGTAFTTVDRYHGQIIAGVKDDKLLGMVGYTPRCREFLTTWLISLQ